MTGDKLKRYLSNIKKERRKHNLKAYIHKEEDNVIVLNKLKILCETGAERRELTDQQLTKGKVIKMCDLCKDDSFHVDYMSSDMPPLDHLTEEICNQIVEELIDFSNLPETPIDFEEYLYGQDEFEEAIKEQEEFMDRVDHHISLVRKVMYAAAVGYLAIAGLIIYNLF